MATEVITGRPRAESHTLRAEEERLRAHLEQQLRVRTRFAPLADIRALLVSPDRDDRPKSLVVSSSTASTTSPMGRSRSIAQRCIASRAARRR